MNIDNVLLCFLKEIPEFENQYIESIKCGCFDDTDGIYVKWGFGIMPSVINTLKVNTDEKLISRIFKFFEEMALGDEEVCDLLMYSTLETLGDNKIVLKRSINFMGERTRELSYRIEAFLGR